MRDSPRWATCSTPIRVESPCGAADLLAAVFGEDTNNLRKRFGLPQTGVHPSCQQCGKPLSILIGKTGLCSACIRENAWIEVACSECGTLKKRRASEIISHTSRQGYEHFFCNRKCRGRWAGKHYGFGAHPENRMTLQEHRKYNYYLVWDIHLVTGYGALRLGAFLGIPRQSVDTILQKMRREHGL